MCSPRLSDCSFRLLLAARRSAAAGSGTNASHALSLAPLLGAARNGASLLTAPLAVTHRESYTVALWQRSFAAGNHNQPLAATASLPAASSSSASDGDAWGSKPRWVKGWKSVRQQRQLAQGYKDANAEIRRARDIASLLALTKGLQHLSPINALTILSKLVALKATDRRLRRPKPELDQILRLCGFLEAHAAAGASGYSPQQLAHSLSLLRKLHVRLTDNLLEAVEDQVTVRRGDFSLSNLAAISVVQVVSRRGFHGASLAEAERRFLHADPRTVDPSVLTDLAWCFSSLGQPSEPVLAALGQRLIRDVDAFSGTQLSTAVWAAHVADYLPKDLLNAVVAKVASQPSLLKPGQKASFLHAVASTGSFGAKPALEALQPGLVASAPKLNPQQLALVAGAYALLGVSAPDLMDAVAQSMGLQLKNCKPENLSRSLWALAQAEAPPLALFETAKEKLIGELPQMPANAVPPAAWAYLKATGKLDLDLWNACAEQLGHESRLPLEQQHTLCKLLSDHPPEGVDQEALVAVQHTGRDRNL